MSWRRRVGWVIGAFALSVSCCAYLDLGAFDYFEHWAYGLRARVYAGTHPELVDRVRRQIVLVTWSDDSCDEFRLVKPPRGYHAKAVRDLTRAGAKLIAFDIIFDGEREGDAELAAAARESGRVVWACNFRSEGGANLVLPVAQLRAASPCWGHVQVPRDPDRPAVDKIQAVIRHGENVIPALSVVVAGLAMGAREEAGPLGADARDLGFLDRFVDADGYFSIGYLGSPGNAFPVIPYGEIYNGAVDKPFYRENEFFKGKIVLLGDTTTIGSDDFRTPVGNMPGVEVHAHAIATLLNGRSVREEPWSRNFVALCLLVVLACPLAAVWPLRRAALATVALLMGYFILNVWLFVDRGIWLHLVAPCSAVVLATLGVLTERGLTEEREKDRMRGLLHRYISPQIASHIIADPEGYVLGGERVTATVLFADVRGFSRMSAQLPPEQVVSWLNDHFQWMTHIIFRHDGAVDKYMGDAVMALFGVPVPHPDHALRAVSAAIDLQNELLQRRPRVPSDDRPPIDFGIGISTGEMVVGNVGTTERLDFTAIGDAVNLAARVEGLSRERRCRIHVTESTYRLVSNDVRARGPLTATVKDTTAVVYEVFGWRDPATPAGALDLEPFVAHGNEAGQERE